VRPELVLSQLPVAALHRAQQPPVPAHAVYGRGRSIRTAPAGPQVELDLQEYRLVQTKPTTGETENRQVTNTIRTDYDEQYVDLTIRGADKSQHKITATDNHPFWSVSRSAWVAADQLRPGELLRTAAGAFVQVTAVKQHHARQRTYDLTIDSVHTYYVVAGGTAVLVHNADGGWYGGLTPAGGRLPDQPHSVEVLAEGLHH
jgi:hypothetical protein